MKKEQYFPLVTDLLNQKNVNRLILDTKARGLGIYIAILMELRRQEDFTGDLNLIRTLAKTMCTSITFIKHVVFDYDLFDITENSENIKFTSPYLNQVMKQMEETRARRSKSGKKGAINRWRKTMTVTDGNAIAIYSSSNKTTSSIEQEEKQKTWEKFIDQAVKDNGWLDLVASRTGWGASFYTHCDEIIKAFKEHVLVQGTENNIRELSDAKAYMMNFLRPGTPTHKFMYSHLQRAKKEQSEKQPHRFESVDPITGERSYYGQVIPSDAPPRPAKNAIWDKGLSQWIR